MALYRKCFKCGVSPRVDSSITLFRFPKPGTTNTLRCAEWAKFVCPDKDWASPEFQQQLHSQHKMLCNRHFKRTFFADYPESMKKLHRFAIPDIIRVQSVDMPQLVSSQLQTINETRNEHMLTSTLDPIAGPSSLPQSQEVPCNIQIKEKSPREKYLYAKCRKNMVKLCQLRKRISKLTNKEYLKKLTEDEVTEAMVKKLSPTFALLLQAQIKNFSRKSKGRRWKSEEKIIALQLYKRSPTCYRLMRRLFSLPSQATLKSLLSHLELKVGVNKEVLEAMGNYAKNQAPCDNKYVLMFDEMSVKKHLMYNNKTDTIEGFQDHGHHGRNVQVATHALVFMLAGIRKKVKQPVAYYFSSSFVTANRLAVLIKEVYRECTKVGLNISSTVCDMDGVNRRALGILGATMDRPYIVIDNTEVVAMYDPPHLLKCFRNLILKYDIKCITNIKSNDSTGVGIAKWSHIEKFHELDSSNPNFVFAPALKAEHLHPNTKQKMKVKLAAQVLSHTVAAGMMAKISQGELTTEATTTADVIENIDKLFDALNSDSRDLRRGKPFSTNLKQSSPHLQHFQDMKKFFHSLEFIGCRIKTPPSKEGWVWTLNAVERLWSHLSKDDAIKSLATRRLQQDPLENLFGCIRGNCGANANPTAGQFVAALKTAVLSNLAQFGSGNCEVDNNITIINNMKELLTKKPTNICTAASPNTQQGTAIITTTFENKFVQSCSNIDGVEVGEFQACAYVCGFLVKNIINECDTCKHMLITTDLNNTHSFVTFKEFTNVQSLNYCNKELINFVENCATTTNNFLKTNGHEHNIKNNIIQKLRVIPHDCLSKCPDHLEKNVTFLIKSIFHICVKRFCILQNRKFGEDAAKIALRKKINILKHK